MPTIGEALDAAEDRLFVNRHRELSVFGDWLAGGPPLLKVDGPGGIGKTALVRAFRRHAVQSGRSVVLVDGADIAPHPEAFLEALSPACPQDAGKVLSDARAVLILDTFERVYSLTPFLQDQFLPELDQGVQVVMAGRHPLGRPWAGWSDLTWTVNLSRLARQEVDQYLERRGVKDSAVREAVWRASRGHPLAVSLAADLAVDLGVREFSAQPEWHLSIRRLVEELLRDIHDARLRRLLEAAACVRQFDEPTLAAMSGDADVSSAFAQLCQLSVVRSGDHGLMLHDDVRQILVDDLRWRHQERYEAYRCRAMDFYRERARNAPANQVSWVNLDRLFLSEQALVHARVFGEADPAEHWVQASLPAPEVLRAVFDGWAASSAVSRVAPPSDELSWAFVDALLSVPGVRVPVCRDRQGTPIGYGFFLPIAKDSLAAIPDGVIKRAVTEWCATSETPLPDHALDSNLWYLSTIAVRDDGWAGAIPPLTRACFEAMTGDRGQYLALTREPAYTLLVEACGFYPVGEIDDQGSPLTTFYLDVESLGPESVIEGLLTFQRPPQTLRGALLEREVEAALTAWDDLEGLGCSALGEWIRHRLGPAAAGDGKDRGRQVRTVVDTCLDEIFGQGGDEQEAARSLQLGYLRDHLTHDAAARRMHVSRATFYRLRRRGVELLSAALWRRLRDDGRLDETPLTHSGAARETSPLG